MERGGAKASGVSNSSAAVFQRGRDDESLWDDGELIRLWNAQLEQQQQNQEGKNIESKGNALSTELSDDDSLITSETSVEESKLSSASASSSLSADPKEAIKSFPPRTGTVVAPMEPVSLIQDGISNLPADIQRLVSAFYRAGYESGYIVGRNERRSSSKVNNHNKRPRDD
ncbi:uncharacterized protein TM35_000221480 [Trypanosoma theileri]|uniref:Uncharacterized protein n=1 Tax=Trypanosoma theileri TaxID=67003 RepID=A0A1X0NT35_9TRYP|nr:uncharacterized protein TM35_000221480 [Trypanosoma theileri]ORC87349.1 hypothetical protein TM35_000221480 [Trypanosoma theileri]